MAGGAGLPACAFRRRYPYRAGRLSAVFDGQLIGVDVGGTKVAVATLEDARLSDSLLRPTEGSSPEGLVEEVVAGVEEARNANTAAVGIGVPSVVEFATGRVRSSVNLKLADFDLRGALEERLGVPVFVDNDATVAALAEAFDESGRPVVQNLVMFTVGTGVGGGLVLGGKVYRGTTGAAGELGHTMVGADFSHGVPPSLEFPQRGALESVVSGRILDRLAAKIAADSPRSALGKLAAGGREVDGNDAVRAAKDGDPEAIQALRTLGERLGIGIANALNTFDPDEVVIGGGVSSAGELLLGPAKDVARRFALPGVGERAEIRLARHGKQAGVRGAALLAGLELSRGDEAFASRREVEPA
jgi:glucokinase